MLYSDVEYLING